MKIFLIIGAILGLTSVIIAAYLDHSLALYLSDKSLHGLQTAVRYQQFYSLMICMIGFVLPLQTNNKVKSWLYTSGFIFSLGIIFFTLGIYLSSIVDLPKTIFLTPVGGILLMMGWFSLLCTAVIRAPSLGN